MNNENIEYTLGRALVNKVWKEDKDSLRDNVEIYGDTYSLVGAIWKAYKDGIPKMGDRNFWKNPMDIVQPLFENGKLHGDLNSDNFAWMFYMGEAVTEASPSYGTVTKLLIGFDKLFNYLWYTKYCESITGDKPDDSYKAFKDDFESYMNKCPPS